VAEPEGVKLRATLAGSIPILEFRTKSQETEFARMAFSAPTRSADVLFVDKKNA
jgi:hypothetical protein